MNDVSRSDPEQALCDFADRHPEFASMAGFRLLDEDNPKTAYPLQPWPLLLPPETSARIRRSTVALIRLARDLLQRRFDNRPGPIADYFQVNGGEMIAELVLSEPNGVREAMYRGDFIETAEGFKCIEINAGSGLSGWQLSTVAPLYSRVPLIERFLAENGWQLDYEDTLRGIFRHLLAGLAANSRSQGRSELHLAFAINDRARDLRGRTSEEECQQVLDAVADEVVPGTSCRFSFCPFDELRLTRDHVAYRGSAIDVLFEQMVDFGTVGRQLFGLQKSGKVILYTGPATRIIGDKRLIALLSESQRSEIFDHQEQQLIAAMIPWTRRLRRETTDYRGEQVSLTDLLESHRRDFVLKRGLSHSGIDVHVGRETGDAAWQERIAQSLSDGDWIVQEYLETRPRKLLDRKLGVCDHNIVWGFFVFGDEFRGGFLRAAPTGHTARINVPQGVTTAPYFEIRPAE